VEARAVPRTGDGAPRTLFSFPRPYDIWGINAGRDGSLYFDYMLGPTSILKFDTAAKSISETVVTLHGAMLPLDAGSFLFDRVNSGKRHLAVYQPTVGERDLLESSEDSSSPMARIGNDSVAFLLGSGDSARIAIATLRDGRIVKRFSFGAASINSIAATPDGTKLYYCDSGRVWSVGTKSSEEAKPIPVTNGDSIAIDAAGKYLYVNRMQNGQRALVRVLLAGGQTETLAIPPQYTISDDLLSPAAADASGRVLFEVDSANSWFEQIGMIDTSRKTFTVVPTGFSGDQWLPGWESDGRIVAVGVRLSSSLWRYKPYHPGS